MMYGVNTAIFYEEEMSFRLYENIRNLILKTVNGTLTLNRLTHNLRRRHTSWTKHEKIIV